MDLTVQLAVEKLIKASLKNNFRYDLVRTRVEYDHLGAVLFFGVAVTALSALLTVRPFEYKTLIYIYTSYCFYLVLYTKLRPPGYSLAASVLQVPFGLLMIISLQCMMPEDLVYFTSFLYPIVFVFVYEFHTKLFTRIMFMFALVSTGMILYSRGLPHIEAYLITTFGSTLIIGQVVGKASEKIVHLANHDSLTGLMTRRYWEESLKYLMSLAKRDGTEISISYLDIDNFKQVNDKHGHAQGDLLLTLFAEAMKNVCREADLLTRWGGDEFAIAMPNTNKKQAKEVIRRLDRMLAGNPQFSSGTVSVIRGESLEKLLRRADHEMYKIKEERRNNRDNRQKINLSRIEPQDEYDY